MNRLFAVLEAAIIIMIAIALLDLLGVNVDLVKIISNGSLIVKQYMLEFIEIVKGVLNGGN